MPDFQYDRKRFVEPVSLGSLERAARRNAYDIETKVVEVETTSPTTPTTPILPGGTLVTPPVVAGPDGYPIPRAIPGDDMASNEWFLYDGTQDGFFPRTLLTNSPANQLAAINLGNLNQRVSYPSLAFGTAEITSLRGGRVSQIWRYWQNGTWVQSSSAALFSDGQVGELVGFSSALGHVFQDATHTYFMCRVTVAGTTRSHLCRIAHGDTVVYVVSPALPDFYSNAVLLGVGGGIAWVSYDISSVAYNGLGAIDLATQTFSYFGGQIQTALALYAFSRNLSEYTSFVLSDGRLAFLGYQASDGFYPLKVLSTSGVLITQSEYYPQTRLPGSLTSSLRGRAVPGGNAILVPTTAAGVFDNLTPQGWQELIIPAPAGGTVSNSSVRWKSGEWGTTLQWASTQHLYEGSIAS